MAEILASRLLPFKNAITHTISLPACTCGVESAAPERLLVSPERSCKGGQATSDRQGQVRIASQSKAAEVTVACLGKTRLRSISCASRSGSAQQSPATEIR